MRTMFPAVCCTVLLATLLLPLPAQAMPAITCHCFTERSFDPGRPAAADPYFLATIQNSFFAALFNTDKKAVVMKKQQGVSADDLWVAYWAASKSGMTAANLLQSRQAADGWQEVLVPLRLAAKDVGTRFTAGLNAKATSARLALAVVDEIVVRQRLITEKELAQVRQAGASSQELILAVLIAAKSGQTAQQVYLRVKSGAVSWGALLQAAKIDTKNLQQEISATLKSASR